MVEAEIAVITMLVLVLLGVGAWVAAGKGVRLPKFSLPADHDVSASDPEWASLCN